MRNVERPKPKRVSSRLLLAAALVAIPACAPPPPPDPLRKPVATLDGKVLTVADLEEYLRNNLEGEDKDEAVLPGEMDAVKSRLFENFVDEEVLLAEARRRGVRVTPEELRSYLDSGAEGSPGATAPGETHRETAMRDLTIQKLREETALGVAEATPAEVDAYLAANRESLRARPQIVLRSFALASPGDAEKTRTRILAMKRKLDEAAREGEDLGPEGGQLQEVSVDALPPEVREALAKLEPGQVSPVVTLEGTPYLFYFQSRPAGISDTDEALRARAADVLLRARVEEASARFLERLKRRARIELHPENLPFRYVPEEGVGGAAAAKGRD